MKHSISLVAAAAILATTAQAQLGLKCANTAASGVNQADDAIEVPYSATLVPATGITVEAWITYDETTLGSGWRWPTVCRMNPAPGRESYFLRVAAASSSTKTLTWGVATAFGFVRVNYSFAAGELKKWTHVAGTYDGQNVRLFLNGVEKGSLKLSSRSSLRDNGGSLHIGTGNITAAAGKAIEMWNGEIDEFRIWPVARTAAEISSTMNMALSTVPGRVSTWNLDFSASDSSGKNPGKAINKPNYVANSLTLFGIPLGAVAYGTPTNSCAGVPAAGVTGYAKAGNAGFALTCLKAAKNNGSGITGLMWLGFGKLSTPQTLLGASLWVDLSKPGLLVPVLGNLDGLARVPAPIPASTPTGVSVHIQFVFNHPGCTTVPLFASEGLTLTIQ